MGAVELIRGILNRARLALGAPGGVRREDDRREGDGDPEGSFYSASMKG
jgi:hypothetical protein